MKSFYVIGLMSGTSLDGVDLVYVKFNQNEEWNFDIINSKTYQYKDSVIKLLTNISKKSLDEVKKIDVEYTKKLAKIIREFIDEFSINKIDFMFPILITILLFFIYFELKIVSNRYFLI